MDALNNYLLAVEAEKRDCLSLSEKLKADDRSDEANMEKIRANVYDIAAAVIRAAEKQAPGGPLPYVRQKLDTIPNAWRASLSAAEQHAEFEKVMVERVKLETMEKILKLNASGGNDDRG